MSDLSTSSVSEVVVDSCVAGAWSFKESDTAKARRVLQELVSGRLVGIVPSLFWAEFQQICGKKRHSTSTAPALSLADIQTAYEGVERLPLVELGGELRELRDEAWGLRRSLGIASHDAYYLALALELGTDVWTLDRDLREAVNRDAALAGRVKLVGLDVLA